MSTTIYNNNNSSSSPSSVALPDLEPINHNHNNNNINEEHEGENSLSAGIQFSSEDEEDSGPPMLAMEEEVVTSNSIEIENDVGEEHYNNVDQEEEVETEEQVGDYTISNNNHDTNTESSIETPSNNQYHGYNNETPSSDSGISRAGRVRKKNSLLAGYEFDTSDSTPSSRKHKNEFRKQRRPGSVSPDITDHRASKKKRGRGRPRKSTTQNHTEETVGSDGIVQNSYFDGADDADLEMDLPPEFSEADLPELAAEEIIDDIIDSEDLAQGIVLNSNSSRLKSQAESAYMMEKTQKAVNHRRSVNHSNASSSNASPYLSPPAPSPSYGPLKFKLPKKDKPEGHKRVTGYILWASEQKKTFTQNYPHMDFNVQSTRLAEKWNSLPANQKKLWKTKASKAMKGGAGDNIKNSAKILPKKPPGKRGRKSKLELLAIAAARNANPAVPVPTPAHLPLRIPGQKGRPGRKRKYFPDRDVQNHNLSSVNGSQYANLSQSRRMEPLPGTSRQSRYSPKKELETPKYKVTGLTPIDLAAHFSLLGESLSNIGERLQERAGEPVSGILSVLLDTFICGVAPLLCLTTQIKEINSVPPERLKDMLEHFAINMPGI